jgi:glycosyltransferase involved in cell wall biosynthesis
VAKIVFITQVVDPSDPNLGATRAKIAALARRVDEVVVLCDRGSADALPVNCRVRTFGARRRSQRAYRFLAAIAAELRERPLAVIAHMIPLYVVVAAPLVRPRRVPLLLWYSHWRAHLVLRVAVAACTGIVTVDERSFPLRSSKVRGIGHGIDLAEFPCQPASSTKGRALRVLSLGRYTPPKKLDELIEGVRLARDRGVDVRIDLYGTTGAPRLEAYKSELETLVRSSGYADFATVGGPIPRTEVPAAYAGVDVVASNFFSPDKIVLEACSSCRPVLASQQTFDRLFAGIEPSLAFERGRPETFAERIEALALLDDEERYNLGRELRERVSRQHSVETWASAILELVRT